MNKLFLDMDGTLAKFMEEEWENKFLTEEGFFKNLKPYKGIKGLAKIMKKFDTYILSASPHDRATQEKLEWIKEHLPTMDMNKVIICNRGDDKAKYIKNTRNITIDKSCYLLDDYGVNLEEWTKAGGTPLKRITPYSDNSSKRFNKEIKVYNDLIKYSEVI